MSGSNGNRVDIFSPSFGMVTIGAGLLALAGVEAARIAIAPASEPRDRIAVTAPETPVFLPSPAATLEEPQDAVGTGPGAPAARGSRGMGALIGMAASPMPNGLAIFRLYANGAVEAMIATEDNRWGAWVPVAPGLSTDMRRPAASDGNPDTENTP